MLSNFIPPILHVWCDGTDYSIKRHQLCTCIKVDGKGKSTKCDLCIDTPYWNEKGGIGGKQACVETCPMQAIKFVTETPNQEETDGYNVNLRNDHWLKLGLVDDSRTAVPGMGGFGGGAPKGKPGAKPEAKPKA